VPEKNIYFLNAIVNDKFYLFLTIEHEVKLKFGYNELEENSYEIKTWIDRAFIGFFFVSLLTK